MATHESLPPYLEEMVLHTDQIPRKPGQKIAGVIAQRHGRMVYLPIALSPDRVVHWPPMNGAGHRAEIEYCTQCRWLPRAVWLAQELLTTFEGELTEVALVPGKGGVLEIRVDEAPVWSLKSEKRLPEPKELKRLVRDRVAPGRALGHADRAS